LDCALAVMSFSRLLRSTPEASALGLGRTRIGMESGKLVVGDVGGGRRLDYTAYGEAMNLAARLEAANKELGSTICIGPTMAKRLAPQALRPLGSISIRGMPQPIEVFEPWPESFASAGRQEFIAAASAVADSPIAAVGRLRALSASHPEDDALRRYADRLAATLPRG
jgi:adenylate cyclase